ncbi:site-specific DNA-methyltransferase [Enterococcus hirae]|uniref:site-specific DNA-methyltransferase n=1 Tax=Enterococcus hirae TaxID=1354 RepID=UPI0021E944E2|nr:site-specific DNA-methyltransferase [Enterococcus hirae]MCV3110432.1 site-specific DNA-methyltransferase [Enterococcus hirae]
MDTRLMKQIKDILKEFPQYWNGEELQRPIVIDDLKNYDALLISALLKNQKIRENYSIKAGDVVIFKVQEFIDILRYKDYWEDSYTKYSNTIGLSSEGKYLQYNTDVVLDFPYKDCVLEGGMTKEDTGKEEVFYNEVIARDEIDTLLAPKVLVNVKKYDADGEHKVDTFSDEDNLIIKGNNLLALHSLKERYAGKVKLILIDPPYNTSKDSFKYNDRFNRSTWLTFMRNRLDIANMLLSDEGIISIHIDNNEQAYLKVLMDEIFNEQNYLATLIWENKEGGGKSDSKFFRNKHEYILVYSKNINNAKINGVDVGNLERYSFKDEHYSIRGPYYLQKLGMGSIQYSKSLDYPIQAPDGTDIYPSDNNNGNKACWRWSLEKLKWGIEKDYVVIKKDSGGVWTVYTKQYLKADNNGNEIDRKIQPLAVINKYSTTQSSKHMRELFGNSVFAYSKPEGLEAWLLEIMTKKQDLVLDFHIGSGTTASAAMKMNRRFIGIEQMDYINTVSVPRLQKVIEGEQGGISKDVNWQGGGSFVYAELMELNQLYMNKIDQVSTKEELADLWNELDNNADLNFQLDKEKLVNELLKENDEEEGSVTFNDLTFEEQKEIFKKALDKNQLYVPYSEIEDKNVIISDDDKAFNHSFYSNEGE